MKKKEEQVIVISPLPGGAVKANWEGDTDPFAVGDDRYQAIGKLIWWQGKKVGVVIKKE